LNAESADRKARSQITALTSRVRTAIHHLTPQQRQALNQALGGVAYKDVAAEMGLPPATVALLVREALTSMRTVLIVEPQRSRSATRHNKPIKDRRSTTGDVR
jgi:DNA-directed RNA polymerase specialized sigma24 family protein